MVSSTSAANNLTAHNTASGGYSLAAITVVVVIFLRFVLAYRSWTYYVFRRRVSHREFEPVQTRPARVPPAQAQAVRLPEQARRTRRHWRGVTRSRPG